MNVWSHLPTIFNQRRVLQIAGILTLCVALITTLFFSISTYAAPGVNQTISFQGRLLDSSGDPVPDGYYNIQFKIYQDGTGTAEDNPGGTLEWTETYINNGGNNGVYVKNGYMSVNLGSQTPFGSSVDWNQDTLWLSMNIAGSSTGCSTFGTAPCADDGEMLPMKRLTSTPYSMNSGRVGGRTVDQLVHNGTTQQTADFNISGTGIAGILQGSTKVATPTIDTIDPGTLSIGTTTATAITMGSATTDQTIAIGTGSGNNTVTLGSNSGTSSVTIQGGSNGIALNSEGDVSLTVADDGSFTLTNNSEVAVLTVQGDGEATLAGNLEVTGAVDANSFDINGVSTLNDSSLAFSGTSTATISAAENQALQLNADGGIKIGDGAASGEPTLITLDQSSTTPTASGASVLGSMYYDTTIGKVQCYEADGWGDCSASPDRFVTLSPEYANAVTNGTDTGTFSSDLCSDALDINDGSSAQPAICNTNETYNFYKWTTTETSAQTKDIYVTYELPSNFTEFVDSSTSLAGFTDASESAVAFQVYKNTSSGLTACGSSVSVSTGAQTSWQKVTASGGADPANCGFTAGDSVVFKITLTAEFTTAETNAYVSTLSFAFSDS